MKGMKVQKGITLIALIITIIVLLILAVVAIREVQGDGIIAHAKNAIREHQIGREKETITLSLNGWKLDKQVNRETTFKSFMEESLQNKARVEGPDAGPLTVTFEDTQNQYIVTDDGTITFVEKSIIVKDENGNIISQNTITVEVGKTKVLTVEKTGGLEGEITYKISDDTIATIDESGKVTGIAEGTTKIKIECGKHKIECEVTVTNTPVDPPIDEIPEDLEKYILGELKEGRDINQIFNGSAFINDVEPKLPEGETAELLGYTQFPAKIEFLIKYKGDKYRFDIVPGAGSTIITDKVFGVVKVDDSGIPENLKKYILGELDENGNRPGKDFWSLLDGEGMSFIDDETTDEKENETVLLSDFEIIESEETFKFIIQYTVNNKYYEFIVKDEMSITDPVHGLVEYAPKEFNLEDWFLGEDRQGKQFNTIMTTKVEFIAQSNEPGAGEDPYVYLKYQDKYYKYKLTEINDDWYTDAEYGIREIENYTGERLGKYVEYGDIDGDNKKDKWIIIYDDEIHGIQMISADSYKYNGDKFCLGYNDTLITDWETLGKTSELERSIYSYNHAISTLNTACDNLISKENRHSKIVGVRCVGSNPDPNNIYSENTTLYETNILDGVFNKKGYSEDLNYEYDCDRMYLINWLDIDIPDPVNGTDYWLASRKIEEDKNKETCEFCIRDMYWETESPNVELIFGCYDEATYNPSGGWNASNYLRPVIMLDYDTVFGGGDGTSADSAYTLD